MKKKLFTMVLAVLFWGSSLTANAAPQYMADGAVFDAEWYREQNPDIAAAWPEDVSTEVLYQHYVTFGKNEGRTPYNAAAFNPASVLPYQGNTVEVPDSTVQTGLTPAASYNINRQDYTWSRWAHAVMSYLYENQLGGLTRVECIGQQIVVEDYDSSYRLVASRTIPMELSKWGGFFAGDKYNFLIFGQNNPSQNDDTEVIRIVKYSKDWQRLGQAGLYGANTTVPFEAGSLRCAENGDYLYVRTCHKMYASQKDGKNHQANVTLALRQGDMDFTITYYGVVYNTGYVSHSFNQFLLVDQDKRLVTVDHGDAYPRSIVLMRCKMKDGGGKQDGNFLNSTIMSFPGNTGDNETGASVGGLAETANGYVTVFNYDGAGGRGKRELYIAYTSKDGLKSSAAKLTESEGVKTPVIAPAGLDGGYLMWNGRNGGFYYTRYTDGGQIGAIGTADAALSDCQPICHNGEVVWYVTNGSAPVFYRINASGMITVTNAQ
ncbi:MAG: hypothetical protein K2N34_05490 [Lachnospiraceae bacterium]|nr:hypothetical protein [Lachnospiraceae bacterium]